MESDARQGRRIPWFEVCAAALLALSIVYLPESTAGRGIDESWNQAYGAFLKGKFQAGADYLFNGGPLGYFFISPYDASLFGWKLVWEAVVKLAAAVLIVAAIGRSAPALLRVALVVYAMLALSRLFPDAIYFLLIAAGGSLLLRPGRLRARRFVPILALFALVALVKFTFLLLGVTAAAAVSAAGARPGRRDVRLLALPLFAAALATLWILLGQRPGNLGPYLSSSWELARGYNEGMALEGPASELYLGALAFLLAAAQIALVAATPGAGVRGLATALVGVAGLVLAFKNGFVRHDLTHAMIFFAYAPLGPAFLDWPVNASSRRRTALAALRGACLAAALAGLFVTSRAMGTGPARLVAEWADRLVETATVAARPRAAKAAYDAERVALANEHAMPAARAMIGEGAVDLISHEQGVLFLNGFRWRPRPVFQNYSAFTKDLLDANARFLAGPEAPDYLLFRMQTIDERVPAADFGESLAGILCRYREALREGPYLVLKRDPGAVAARPPEDAPQAEVHARLGEAFDVDTSGGGFLFVRIRVEQSLRGRIRAALLRAAPLYLVARFEDGTSRQFRLIRPNARCGFLLEPFLRGQGDVLRWSGGEATPRVVSLAVGTTEALQGCFAPEVEVEISRLTCPVNSGRSLPGG